MKFKPGDKVICIRDVGISYDFKKGKIYTVREFPTAWGSLGLILDEKGSTTNGARPENFKLLRDYKPYLPDWL